MKIYFEKSQLHELGSMHDVICANGFAYLGIYEKTWMFAGRFRTKTINVFYHEKTLKNYVCSKTNLEGDFEMKPIKLDGYYTVGI